MPVADPSSARLAGVRKQYRGGVVALDGIDLSLHSGQVTALLGANGAGKSTAVGVLLGLVQADAGQAHVFGQTPGAWPVRQAIGVMLQQATMPAKLNVHEVLQLVRSGYRQPRSIADCTALAGLEGILKRPYGKLSGGQQRRVQFALALCGRPRLLFLDEPTTGLDIQARQQLWAAIGELVAEGCGVLLTTHYLEEAEALAHRVAVMHAGRVVVEGSVHDIRARVGLRQIRCRSQLQADAVARCAHVHSVVRDGEHLQVLATQAEPVVRHLLQADADLQDLEVRRAGLAEAFLEITRDGQSPVSQMTQEGAIE